jgi:hypothetical protein
VKQPARSSNWALEPAAQRSQTGADGMVAHGFTRANLNAGEALPITIRYNKSDQSPSLPRGQVAPAGPQPEQTAPTAAAEPWTRTVLPWIAVALGVALLASAAGYWLWTQRRDAASAGRPVTVARSTAGRSRGERPQGARARPVSTPAGGPATPAAFCPKCGRRYRPEDDFCAACGAPRRR